MKKIFMLISILNLFSCAGTYNSGSSYSPYSYETRQLMDAANNATYPTDDEIKNLKYSKQPRNHEASFKTIVKENLKDPDSAKFRNIQKPKKFWGKSLSLINFWLICGEVNSKNGYGGYSGYEVFAVKYLEDNTFEILPLDEGKTRFTYAKETYPCAK